MVRLAGVRDGAVEGGVTRLEESGSGTTVTVINPRSNEGLRVLVKPT